MPLVMMRDVEREELDWLWPGRLLFGKYNVLVGDGGIGKSTLVIDLAARLSRGLPLPDGTVHEPCGTLLIMPEDGAGDTIRPRLENHGADLGRIGLIQTITDPEDGAEVLPTIPDNVSDIENAIVAIGARMLVLDPLLQFMGDSVNEYRDKEVRRAMAPLIAMCERQKVALVGLMHVTKANSGNAKHRGNAAAAFMNLSRSTLFAAVDPDIPNCFVLAQSKTNLGPMASSLRYRLEGQENGHARVAWEGVSAHTADTLNAQGGNEEERSELREAEEFLLDFLSEGPELYQAIIKAARAMGISERTLKRAKASLQIDSEKASTQPHGQWKWYAPGQSPKQKAAREKKERTEQKNPEEGHATTTAPLDPLARLATLHNTNNNSKECQECQEGQQCQQCQESGYKNAASFGGSPIVVADGKYECAHCSRVVWLSKGSPQLCAKHKAALGRTGSTDEGWD